MEARKLRRRTSIVVAILVLLGVCALLALPVASWVVERQARARADSRGEQLGLTIEWAEISLSLAGFSAIDVQLRGLQVRAGAAPLLLATEVRARVDWQDGAVVRDVAVAGATLQLRLVDDRPQQLLALREAWAARPRSSPPAAASPADEAARAPRPWPALRLEDCRLAIEAVGGRSEALDGLVLGLDGADVALQRPAESTQRPLGTMRARLALSGPASGAGAVQLRSVEGGVELDLDATQTPWRWQRPTGTLGSASVAAVALRLDVDAALALRVSTPDASTKALLDALRGSVRVRGAQAMVGDEVQLGVGDLRAAWPESTVQLGAISLRSATFRALRALAPAKLGGPLQEFATALALPEAASVSLDIDRLDAGNVSVLLAGGGEPWLRGFRLQLGDRRLDVGHVGIKRPGATLIGKRKPAELHVAALRVEVGDLAALGVPVPPQLLALIGHVDSATERHGDDQEPAVGSAEAGPPPEALRPLWTSTPAKTEPSTRKYAAPLAALPAKLDAGVAALVSIREKLAKQRLVLDVRDAALTARLLGMEIGLRDVDFALQPRARSVPGRATLALSLMLRGRRAGSLSLSMALPSASMPLELAISAQGDDLARVVAGLDRRLGLGAKPALQLDGLLVAGAGIGGELRATVSVRHIGIDWWRFAERKVDNIALDVDLGLHWAADLSWMRLDLGELAFGAADAAARMRASGWVLLHRLKPSPRVDLSLLLPSQDCGEALDAIPEALLPTVGRIRAAGPISGWVDLRVDIAHPWYSEIDFALDDARCRIDSTGKLDVDGLKGDFERPVNEDGTLLHDQTFGPASPAWISIGRMPRWLPYAMTTTEDGGFFQHHGLNAFLLNRAIRLDLHVGRFVYGGSTITQQLAKNLFFRRTKVLSRKLEEALATWLLERRLGKTRILEIYANAVEMAPHLYGVARGAQHYFGKDADQLGPAEAAWLGILKPCPRCAGAHFRAKSMPGWYQQRLLEILTRMWRNHIIDDATFELWQNRVPPFVDWPAEKLAQRSSWPIPEKKEPDPRRLDRGRAGDGARSDKARGVKPADAAPRPSSASRPR